MNEKDKQKLLIGLGFTFVIDVVINFENIGDNLKWKEC